MEEGGGFSAVPGSDRVRPDNGADAVAAGLNLRSAVSPGSVTGDPSDSNSEVKTILWM